MTSTTPYRDRDTEASPVKGLLRRWPSLAAIVLTGLTAFGLSDGSELAPIVAASGLVYLGAAALRKPAMAWPLFFGTFVILTVAKVLLVAKLSAAADAPTWVLLGLAVLFLIYGLLRGAARPPDGLPLQAIAMAAFGAIAAIAVLVNHSVGAYLVAAGLFGHAAWDVYHHRINKVVVRSMAEFCFVLDTLLAVIIVIVTVRG
jgi:cytochrome b561